MASAPINGLTGCGGLVISGAFAVSVVALWPRAGAEASPTAVPPFAVRDGTVPLVDVTGARLKILACICWIFFCSFSF